VLGAAAHDGDGVAPMRRDGRVALQELSVAENGVERRAQLVADAHHETALGQIGGLRGFLGTLQLLVGLPMRLHRASSEQQSEQIGPS
jgi:hypothetical protein